MMKVGDFVFYYNEKDKEIRSGLLTMIRLCHDAKSPESYGRIKYIVLDQETGSPIDLEAVFVAPNSGDLEVMKTMWNQIIDTMKTYEDQVSDVFKECQDKFNSEFKARTKVLTASIDNLRIDIIGEPAYLKQLREFELKGTKMKGIKKNGKNQ